MDLSAEIALSGFTIYVAGGLAGGAQGIVCGRRLYVSPAMLALIQSEDSDGLKRLFAAIDWIRLPDDFLEFADCVG